MRIFSRTSGEIVIGKLPVGSLGAKSNSAKMIKLITNRVGIAISVRRSVYVNMHCP
jgi:hypothetical protein